MALVVCHSELEQYSTSDLNLNSIFFFFTFHYVESLNQNPIEIMTARDMWEEKETIL